LEHFFISTPHHQSNCWVEQMTFSLPKGYGRHNRKSSHPDNETLAALFLGMQKLHNLVDYLRYGFGGIMDAMVALSRISNALLK
jgi:hypothetical protein